LSKPQVQIGEEEKEEKNIAIIDLKFDQHTATDFQRSLRTHICTPLNKDFDNSEEKMDIKKEYTDRIDALNNNMALKQSKFGDSFNSTVFTFLLKRNELVIKEAKKENPNADIEALEKNTATLAALKANNTLGNGCLGIQKNLDNQEKRISPLQKALEL